MHNKEVTKTIDEVCKNFFTHGAEPEKLHLLSKVKHTHPVCFEPGNPELLDQHFIKEAQAGRYIVATDIEIRCRVPFFLKPEGPGKVRFIPDYTHPKNGTSINSLVPDKLAKVELLDRFELLKFAYNKGKTTTLGKNDFKSWYRQIPMNPRDWGKSVCIIGVVLIGWTRTCHGEHDEHHEWHIILALQ